MQKTGPPQTCGSPVFSCSLLHCHAQPFDALGQVLQFLFHAYQQVPGNDHGEAILSSLAGQQGQVIHVMLHECICQRTQRDIFEKPWKNVVK